MNKEELTNFIKINMESNDFTSGVDKKQVDNIQIPYS
jgi:antitoxin YobK